MCNIVDYRILRLVAHDLNAYEGLDRAESKTNKEPDSASEMTMPVTIKAAAARTWVEVQERADRWKSEENSKRRDRQEQTQQSPNRIDNK